MRTTLIHQAQHQDALRPAAFLLPTWEEGPCPLVQLLVHLRCADLLILSEDFPPLKCSRARWARRLLRLEIWNGTEWVWEILGGVC